MPHLIFLPDGASPRFFLWNVEPPAGEPANLIVSTLVSVGRSSSARVVGSSGDLAVERGSSIELFAALPALAAVPCDQIEWLPASIGAWSAAAKLALELVARGRMVPVVSAGPEGGQREGIARWRASLAMPEDAERAKAVADAMPPAAHAVPSESSAVEGGSSAPVWRPDALLQAFLDDAADAVVRAAVAMRVAPVKPTRSGASRAQGVRASAKLGADRAAPWELRFVFALVSEDPAVDLTDASGRSVASELSAWGRPAIERSDRPVEEARIGALAMGELGLHREGRLRLRLRMRIGAASKASRAASSEAEEPPRSVSIPLPRAAREAACPVDLQAPLRFWWEVAIGDELLSLDDLDALQKLYRSPAQRREPGPAAGPDELNPYAALVAQGGGILPASMALRAALEGSAPWAGVPRPVNVVLTEDVAAAIQALNGAREAPPPPIPRGLRAALLTHEERGFAWLARLASFGLGGCLADGPGLDKRLQVVAFLLHRREIDPEDRLPVLILCPTPAVREWARLIADVAPSLFVARGDVSAGSPRLAASAAECEGAAVMLASHEHLLADTGPLRRIEWSTVLLEDAARVGDAIREAVKRMRARRRIALTSLPLEQPTEALRSVMDLVIPGLLGPADAFRRELALPIKRFRDPRASDRLARLVAPFILRRRVSDPDVIRDLLQGRAARADCASTPDERVRRGELTERRRAASGSEPPPKNLGAGGAESADGRSCAGLAAPHDPAPPEGKVRS